jgi:hypothetical protein
LFGKKLTAGEMAKVSKFRIRALSNNLKEARRDLRHALGEEPVDEELSDFSDD